MKEERSCEESGVAIAKPRRSLAPVDSVLCTSHHDWQALCSRRIATEVEVEGVEPFVEGWIYIVVGWIELNQATIPLLCS